MFNNKDYQISDLMKNHPMFQKIRDEILGDQNDINNGFSTQRSKLYQEMLYQILSDGLNSLYETHNEYHTPFVDADRAGNYIFTILNHEYGLTFEVGLDTSRNSDLVPALNNYVYSYHANRDYAGNTNKIMDEEFVAEASAYLVPLARRSGLDGDKVYAFLMEFPSLIVTIMDNITKYMNNFGITPQFINLCESGLIDFGGIVIIPVLLEDGQVSYRFEFVQSFRYGNKADILFSKGNDKLR